MRTILSRDAFFGRLRSFIDDGRSLGLVVFRIENIRRLRGALGAGAVEAILQDALARIVAGEGVLRRGRSPYLIEIGRLSSDEVGIALYGRVAAPTVRRLAQHVLDFLSQPVTIAGHVVGLDISMGVAEPYPSPDVEQMARRAQMAMEEARGRGLSVSYFSDEMAESADERLQLETLLREALLADEGLYLLYQPQVSLKTGQVESVEALVRWDHPAMGTMLPGRFISFAEERGMGLAICDWVMQRACRQLEAWHRAGLGHIGLSINLSSDSLEIEQIAGRLKGILEETHLNPHRLELEITERFAMTETERSVAACARLKDLGVTLALDDFGTGFSSLTHLQILPVSRLKIDKSFVIGLPDDRQNLALVKGIIGLAHGLGLSVVAEGVESKAQRECLSALGCDSYQGYYFAAPMGADSIESLIRERLMPSLFTFAR